MLITVIRDTAGITKPESYPVPKGTILIDWLINHYGADGFDVPAVVFSGSISDINIVDITDYAQASQEVTGNIFIVHNPCGTEVGVAYIIIAVVLVAAVIMTAPDVPEGAIIRRSSPNNQVTGQTNIARTLDRMPDIFGEVISYPDLINPSAFEFISHIKYITEYMCVGRGFHELSEFKSGNTLISDIPGSEVTIYEPGIVPDDIPITEASNEVASQILTAPNESGITLNSLNIAGVALLFYTVSYDSVLDEATITTPTDDEFDGFSVASTVILSQAFSLDINLSGEYVVSATTATSITFSAAATENPNWTSFDGLTENIQDASAGTDLTPRLANLSEIVVIGPFVVPGEDYSEIWVDLQALKGLAGGKNLDKSLSITVRFTIYEIDASGDPIGPSFTVDKTVSGNTTDPRFFTVKITGADGVIAGNRYEITAERTSDSDSKKDLDQIKWSRMASIKFIDRSDNPGTTRVKILTQATEQVASLQERKFNCVATRKVVTYEDGAVVGDIDTGVGLVASRRFADCFLHYALDPALAARALSNIDVDTLYSIQDSLDAVFDGEKGEFSFTFDNQDTPALEEMRQIVDAARCFMTRTGSYISFIRDQAQPVSRALFNRRNKRPDSESKSIRFNRPVDKDGVTFEFFNRDTGESQTISLPQDLPVDDPNYGLPSPENAEKIRSAGIKNYSQAWDRAQYELNKIIHRRVTIETVVSAEAGTLPLNSRIDHVDGTKIVSSSSNGEIKSFDGLTVSTSEECIFEDGETYSAILRNDLGEPVDAIAVTARADTSFGFVLSSAPVFDLFVRGDNGYQRGCLYNFGPDGDESSDLYLLQRKEPEDSFYYKLELINYTDLYYQADNQTPPEL